MGYAQRNKERILTMKKPGKWIVRWADGFSMEFVVQDWTKDPECLGVMKIGASSMVLIPLANVRTAEFTPDPEDRN